MKALPMVLLVTALSLLGGATASYLLVSRHAVAAGGEGPQTDVARLAAAVEDLRRDQRELRDAVGRSSLQAAAPAAPAAVALSDIDDAVARFMADREERAAASTAAAGAGGDGVVELDVDDAVIRLLDPSLGELERETLWQQVRDAGLLDDVVAVFEARARANPNDPALQVDLGNAYLQKIFEAGGGPLAGVWATKADQTFDVALGLDPQNWEARFTKAVSLSFWPPIFGKQTEAISHFETLLGQQQNQSQQPQFAQTYLWLGNLYQQSGKSELAQQTWSAGLGLFPGDAELLSKLEPN